MNSDINNVTPPPEQAEEEDQGVYNTIQQLDTLYFKYSDIPAGKHIYVKELQNNITSHSVCISTNLIHPSSH